MRDSAAICLAVNFVLDNGFGKGDAQRVGALTAKYEYIIFYDADGSHDPDDIENLYNDITSEKFELIVCSRKKGGSLDLSCNLTFVGLIRSTGCDFLTLLFNLFTSQESAGFLNIIFELYLFLTFVNCIYALNICRFSEPYS